MLAAMMLTLLMLVFWAEYERWFKDDIEAVAMAYYKGDLAPSVWPTYSNADFTWLA